MESNLYFKKLEIALPHGPPVPLSGVDLEASISYYRDSCSCKFIAALAPVAGGWKQLLQFSFLMS